MPHLPPEIIVFFVSMLPVGELRVAIPLGLSFGMPPEAAFFWAEIGNFIAVGIFLWILHPVSTWLMKHSKWCNRVIGKIFHHTTTKHSGKMEKMGEVFILLLAGIPLPGTGAYTGAILAFLFDIPFWKSMLFLTIGNIIAGIIMVVGFGGIVDIIKIFQH